jgi:hypothetical protein
MVSLPMSVVLVNAVQDKAIALYATEVLVGAAI